MGQKTTFLFYVLILIGSFQDLMAETSSCSVPSVENGEMFMLSVPQINRSRTEQTTDTPAHERKPEKGNLRKESNSEKDALDTQNEDKEVKKKRNPFSIMNFFHSLFNYVKVPCRNYKCSEGYEIKEKVHNGKIFCFCVRSEEVDSRKYKLSVGEYVDHNVTLSFHCKEDFAIVEDDKILEDVRVDVTCYDGKWSKDLHCKQNTERSTPVVASALQSNIEDKSPTSNPCNSDIHPPDQCHCTYVGNGYKVQATVENRRLKDGDRVRQGMKVTFSCGNRGMLTWRNGFRTPGNVNMTCKTCQRWETNDIPECKVLEDGGPFIILDDSIEEILPGGSIELLVNAQILFRCASHRYYPRWSFQGQPLKDVEHVISPYIPYFSDKHMQLGYDHVGLYTCHLDLPGYFHERTVIEFRVKETTCPLLANQFVKYSNGNEVGSSATFNCPENTVLVGSSEIYCKSDGTWSSPEPYCEEDCPELMVNQFVTYSNGNKIGSWATFWCPENTVLVGESKILCRNDGTWSTQEPYCRRNSCPQLDNQFVRYSSGNEIGSWVTLRCPENTVLVGDSYITCLYNRTWSSPEPYCRSIEE